MNYHDIETSLMRFKNYEIPIIPKLITNHIIRYPDDYYLFLNKDKNIKDLLLFIHNSFNNKIVYTEDEVLKLILSYFGIESKEDLNHG